LLRMPMMDCCQEQGCSRCWRRSGYFQGKFVLSGRPAMEAGVILHGMLVSLTGSLERQSDSFACFFIPPSTRHRRWKSRLG
jgi:hypothetical protein